MTFTKKIQKAENIIAKMKEIEKLTKDPEILEIIKMTLVVSKGDLETYQDNTPHL